MKVEVKQHDITDCAAACLASVSAYYKLLLSIARIRQYAGTDQKGTSAIGVIEAAEHLGFSAKGVKGSVDSLSKIPYPTIAHVILKGELHHYVVLYKCTKSHIHLMDPAEGKMIRRRIDDFQKEWTGVLILLQPNAAFQPADKRISLTSKFWRLIQPHKTIMFQTMIGAMVYTILGLSTSIYVQKIIDDVIVGGNSNLLNLLGVTMLLVLALQLYLGSIRTVFTIKTGQQIDARLILGYYKHLLQLPQRFFDTMRVGEIISRVNDAVKIRNFINDVGVTLMVNIMIVIFSFCVMFVYSIKLAVILLTVIPLYILVYVIVNIVNKKVQRVLMENSADLESQLVESLNSISTIKKFGIEQQANLKTENKFIMLLKSVYTSGINVMYTNLSTEAISKVSTIVVLWVGGYYVLNRSITPGTLLSFYALIGYFTTPVISLITTNKTIQEALIASDRLFEIMDLETEEGTTKMELTRESTGDIKLNNVFFRYGTRTAVFEGLNVIFKKGNITAVVGESGSGKSTIISLIQNIYPISAGTITIGNHNIQHISNSSLRNIVSVVPQQIDLFAGTVLENIALGDYRPDVQRVVKICKSVGIIEFIERMPNGFQSQIGEKGINLSGGQKQRLAIARAIYKNPEILILDEATSSLDSISEKYVQRTIQFLKDSGKTIIVIAHRLSTIRNADEILVLEKGVLVENGSHDALVNKGGLYTDLWQAQKGIDL